MEFKGSKNWRGITLSDDVKAIRNDGGILIRFWKPDHFTGQDERLFEEIKESEANFKLCLKAPELLEMLVKLRNEYLTACTPEKIFDELDLLIKSATEL